MVVNQTPLPLQFKMIDSRARLSFKEKPNMSKCGTAIKFQLSFDVGGKPVGPVCLVGMCGMNGVITHVITVPG